MADEIAVSSLTRLGVAMLEHFDAGYHFIVFDEDVGGQKDVVL